MKSIIKRVLIGIVFILGVPVVIGWTITQTSSGFGDIVVVPALLAYWLALLLVYSSIFVSGKVSESHPPVDRSFKSSLRRAFIYSAYMLIIMGVLTLIAYFARQWVLR